MDIKILGPGCPKCKVTYKQVVRAVKKIGRNDINIIKVEDIQEMMKYNIMSTPVLVINEDIKIVGRIPAAKEIIQLIDEEGKK